MGILSAKKATGTIGTRLGANKEPGLLLSKNPAEETFDTGGAAMESPEKIASETQKKLDEKRLRDSAASAHNDALKAMMSGDLDNQQVKYGKDFKDIKGQPVEAKDAHLLDRAKSAHNDAMQRMMDDEMKVRLEQELARKKIVDAAKNKDERKTDTGLKDQPGVASAESPDKIVSETQKKLDERRLKASAAGAHNDALHAMMSGDLDNQQVKHGKDFKDVKGQPVEEKDAHLLDRAKEAHGDAMQRMMDDEMKEKLEQEMARKKMMEASGNKNRRNQPVDFDTGGAAMAAPSSSAGGTPVTGGTVKKGGLFAANAAKNNMSEDEWTKHLDATRDHMLGVDPNTGKAAMSDDEFNKQIGSKLIDNLKEQHSNGTIKGSLEELPKKGRGFVIGDLHSNIQNMAAIFERIQADDSTNLDKNPDHKIILLGDTFSFSKEPNGFPVKADTLYAEPMQRFISWLKVRYPNQVVAVNGNHDMSYQHAAHKRLGKGDIASTNPDVDTGAMVWGRKETNGLDNDELAHDQMALMPLMVKIGNRVFQHSPGGPNSKTPAELAQMNDPDARHDEGADIYMGHGDTTEAGFRARNQAMGTSQIYFGHVSPTAMAGMLQGGQAAKVDPNAKSAVGALKGGGNFVDSQTSGENSGYVEINFDDDNAPDKVHTMADVLQSYQPGQLEQGMRAMAQVKRK